MASMIQKILSETMDDRTDPAHFGFRKGEVPLNPYTYIGEYKKSMRKRV